LAFEDQKHYTLPTSPCKQEEEQKPTSDDQRLHLAPASGACIWRLHLAPAFAHKKARESLRGLLLSVIS